LHLIRLIGFALGLLILLTLFHLLAVGLPDSMIRQITTRARERGLPLQIDSIRLSPRHGWVLRNVRIYSTSPDDLEPILNVNKLYAFLWPDRWTTKSGLDISLYGKNIKLTPGLSWETAVSPGSPFRTIDRLNASVTIEPGNLSVTRADLLWGGVALRTRGTLALGDTRAKKDKLPAELKHRGTQAKELLNGLQIEQPPEISIDFNLDAAHPEKTVLNAFFSAENILWNHRAYSRISSTLDLHKNLLTLSSLQIEQADGRRLTADGTFDLKSQMAQLHLQNTLPVDDLLNLLPSRVQNNLTRMEIQLPGRADFGLTLGPAHLDQLAEKISADVYHVKLTRKDLSLDAVQFKLIRDKNRLELQGVRGDANGGPFSGTIEIDLASKAWKAQVVAQCDPAPVGTLRGGGLQHFIGRFAFPADLPKARLSFSQNGTKGSLKIDGTLTGENFTCAGIPLETLKTSMVYANHRLTLDNLQATHEEKRFDGDIQVDFSQKLARFTAASSFDPQTIAQVLAPDHPTILTNFTFSGPVESQAQGQVDYSGGTNHTFRGTLNAKQVSANIIQADTFKTELEGRGDQLIFTNTSFLFCNGQMEGSAAFDLNFQDDRAPYQMDILATQIDFAKFIQRLNTTDPIETRGRLSGTFGFTADAKADFWTSAEGAGQIKIEKGSLHTFPLLGGFSRLIQSPIPGFNLFSLTTFSADYRLTGGALRSENIQLGGTLLSASARGKYSPGKGLNFVVLAEPLRQTRQDKKWYQLHLWGADALKWGTAPIFDLFDFKLEGPLNNPQWRMISLPRELYDIMRRPGKPQVSLTASTFPKI